MEEADTSELKSCKEWPMLFGKNRWIAIQKKDGYALMKTKETVFRTVSKTALPNTGLWRKVIKVSLQVVILASSEGEPSSPKKFYCP